MSGGRGLIRTGAELLGHGLVALAAWVAFTQRLTCTELAAGGAAALVAGIASRLVWSQNGATFRRGGGWLLQAWRLPKYVLTGTGEILAVLALHVAGTPAPSLLRSVPFDAGGEDPRSRGRRALAVAYTSMTPNFIALGVDRERGLLWYHQVRPGAVPAMTVNLGARP